MYSIGVIIIFLALLYKYLTRNSNYWKKRGISYINPVPLIGNLYNVLLLRRSIGDALHDIYRASHSDYVGFFVFNNPALLIRDPQLITRIMITDFEYFGDRDITASEHDQISSNILFIMKNPKWSTVRRKISPIFTISKIKGMLPLVVDVCEELKSYLRGLVIKHKLVENREMFMKFVSDVISSCAFGISDHALHDEHSPFYLAAKRCFEYNVIRALSFYAAFIAPALVKVLRLTFVDETAANFWTRTLWKQMDDREVNKQYRGDLIDLLVTIRKDRKSQDLSDAVIAAQAAQFYFAGFDTTATTIALTIFCIAQHQEVQNKLRQEIRHVTKLHGGITYEALNDAKYLNNVINETLRLYPVLPFLSRKCDKNYEIPGTNTVVEKGVTVYVSLLGLHYDPQYFPDPYKFDADRFDEAQASIVGCTYLPFGEGPRNCIGSRFALMVTKTAIIQLLSEFEIETDVRPDEPLVFDPRGLLLCPTSEQLGLRFKKYVGDC